MPLTSSVPDEPEKIKYYIGFAKGLNGLQDRSLVSDKSLVEATNVELVVDGVTRRRGCISMFDTGSASYVYGASPFYKKTTNERKFVRVANGKLQYLNGNTWTDIGTETFNNAETNFIQARDNLFIYNGQQPLRKYDFSSILTYTPVSTPTGLTVTATGGTGSTSYSYRVSAFNGSGESLACTAVSITNGVTVAELSTSKYNALTWTAVPGATGYNIYGRTSTGFGQVYMATVYTNSYNDTGKDTPVYTKPVPTANTSGGIIAKGGVYSQGRQFVYGITEGSTYYPCRVSYSGVLDRIDCFASNEYGGGWVDVYANDGGEIVGLIPYQDGVLVFKTNGIFKLYFNDAGVPTLSEITRSHGGVSFRAIKAIDNDIIYVGQKENRIAVWILGQQVNITSDTLRTNEVSIFIKPFLEDVNRACLSKIAAFYYDDKFGFTYAKQGYTENMQGYIFDVRFGSWVKWDGLPMKQTQYVVYDDGTNAYLYGCSNFDGYMYKLFDPTISDNGTPFTSIVGTKNYNVDLFNVEKIWRNPAFWFKYISGGQLKCEIWVDGTNYEGTASFTSSEGGGVGGDLAGQPLAGDFYSSIPSTTKGADIPLEIPLLKMSRSIRFNLIDDGNNTNWLFMGISLNYNLLLGKT